MYRFPLLACLTVLLAACGGEPATDTPAAVASSAQGSATESANGEAGKAKSGEDVAVVKVPAQLFAARFDEDSGEGWRYRIKYPPAAQRHPLLLSHLEHVVGEQREVFLESARAPRDSEATGGEWTFELEFDPMLENERMVSLLGRGHSYAGGAHDMPLMLSATLDVGANRMIGIADWFASDKGLGRLAGHARGVIEAQRVHTAEDAGAKVDETMLAELRREIEAGTEPNAEDLGLYHPMPGGNEKLAGLVLLFPPSQVASHAEGSFTVVVPAHMIYDYLKPEYQDWFETPPGRS